MTTNDLITELQHLVAEHPEAGALDVTALSGEEEPDSMNGSSSYILRLTTIQRAVLRSTHHDAWPYNACVELSFASKD